ncbi:MAG: AzlD domain-containing protein [Actinomycetes bacterium]
MWAAVLATSVGSYLLKLLGLSVPQQALDRPRVRRVATLVPVALLAALSAVQIFVSDGAVVVDARAAGLAFAFVALTLRAPFLVVVLGAAVVTAGLRALAG